VRRHEGHARLLLQPAMNQKFCPNQAQARN
jgi:hypothetical protein